MLKIFKATLIFLIFFVGKTKAKELNFTGKILDKETSTPVTNATVLVYKGTTAIYRTISDTSGLFKIPANLLLQGDKIKIHTLNYKDFQIDGEKWTSNNVQYYLGTFSLTPQKTILKEVVIKSTKRYRDTTKIDLSKQNFERSIMIDDLFSNYGFSKDSNGQLFYKGKPIADLEVNGGSFFGKNNMDIYHLLPALVLDKINVIETNIDSVTNTTRLNPILKVNLVLKDKYKKGKFGHINLGAGTNQRYLVNTDLFDYKNKEQVSLALNSNNINGGENTLIEPKVDFSANGNNSTANSSKFTYRNEFANKLDVSLSVKSKLEDKNFTTETDLREENENLLSNTFTTAATKTFSLNGTNLDISYKIDSLNNIKVVQKFDHTHVRQLDSSSYLIKLDTSNTESQLNKILTRNTDLLGTKITWQKKLSSKKGRLLTAGVEINKYYYTVSEFDNVYNMNNKNIDKYFIDGNRSANENNYKVNVNYTEPLGDDSYINFSIAFENDKLNYTTQLNSDTVLSFSDLPLSFSSNYFKPGVKFQRTLDKVSFDADVTGIIDLRTTQQQSNNVAQHFFNYNADFNTNYKINKTNSLALDCSAIANYPGVEQLTNLNSTFDIISQNSGNAFLKPEEKASINLSYKTRPSDSLYINIAGELDHFTNKFGLVVNNTGNSISENVYAANIGNSNGGQISFSLLKSIANGKMLNYTSSLTYQESPTFINNKLMLNNGLAFNQSISTSLMVIKPMFYISPYLASSYSVYFYGVNNVNVTTLTYSDKMSLKITAFQLDLYPLFSYNHSITNNKSFSMNGAIKKNIFKGYGVIWFQAYDIFNSFNYINNYIGASNYQTIKYSNLHRYALLGLSFKFNNMR